MFPKISFILLLIVVTGASAQNPGLQRLSRAIDSTETQRIERVLSADNMEGRLAGTAGNSRAANFISTEMKKAGLVPVPGNRRYFQIFSTVKATQVERHGSIGKDTVLSDKIIVFTSKTLLDITPESDYQLLRFNTDSTFRKQIGAAWRQKANLLIIVDPSHEKDLLRVKKNEQPGLASEFSRIFVVGKFSATGNYHFVIRSTLQYTEMKNVMGMLPGRSKKKEFVLFSSHYDHLGIGKPAANNDSIFNGANDDASGVTAVLQLAKYFKNRKKNQRTLVFIAFTAEELGGFGSETYAKTLPLETVAAMFNIEMIGTESKWGANSGYITGYEKSDFGKILQQNLEGTAYGFFPDPYVAQKLFYRSDNGNLAKFGVPAHTISTSKMDSEPTYHKVTDEFGSLNLANMNHVIKAIALSSLSIVDGKDTPSRIALTQE